MSQLSITHLSSAFLILAAGYLISLSAMVAERVATLARNLAIFHRAPVVA